MPHPHASQASHASLVGRATAAGIALLLGLAGASAAAQAAGEPVLKGRQVNENNLLQALVPDEAPVLTRGIRVGKDAATKPVPARKPAAALLITFETNSAVLTAASREQLDVVAAALKNEKLTGYSFNVEGHADPRGNTDGNLSLSQQRAESVRQYLVSVHGVEPGRLRPVGKGDAEPLNRKDVAAPENRRVTIVTNVE